MQHIYLFMRTTWFRRSLYGLLAFLVLFGLLGYFALPSIIKSQAEKLAGEKLHRQLSIEQVEFQPFSLKLDVHGAKLLEPDGKTVFAAFEHLHVNVSAQSLFRLAPVVQEARLQKPYLHLARTAANHYNVDDIIELIAGLPPSSEPARFSAYNLQVDGGRIEFDDQPVKTGHVVSDFKLGLPFISSLPANIDVFVEPLLSAKVNDAPFMLKGNARPFAEPREATLALDLDAVDLTRYLEYLPFKPRFKVPSAKLDVHLTTIFRQAKDQAPAVLLKGRAAIKSLLITETDGKPMIKLPQLTLTLDELNVFSPRLAVARVLLDQPEIEVVNGADGSLNLSRLAPSEQKNATQQAPVTTEPAPRSGPQLTFGELVIQGARINYRDEQARRPISGGVDKFDLRIGKTDIDLEKQIVAIGAVTSSSAAFSLLHGKPLSDKAVVPVSAPRQPRTGKATPGYTLRIARIGIDNWSARIEDRGLPQAAVTMVNALKLDAQNLSTAAGETGRIDLSAGVNKQGKIAVTGEAGLSPLHADLVLNLKSVDLMPLQPYVTDQVNLLVTRAGLSTKATLKLDAAADGELKGMFKGDLAINDFATIDKLSSNNFLRWKNLSFAGVNARLAPLAINIDQIALNDFFARIIIDANGRINLQDIARGTGEAKSLTEETQRAPVPSATSAPAKNKAAAVPPIRIRQVVMQGGQVRFSDNFIKPNYSAELKDMEGTVSGLSSDAAADADVRLQGTVNSAPLNIAGRINPLKQDLSFDLKADVRGMELAPLSPYSGKYVGYGIEKGKLSFEVAYHLENRKLEAQNRVILDQLTLGEKVESPTATTLPVRLALSLLSDRNGVIDINLPIGGSLDDPEFSVGGIIVKVILNLIAKAVTAPFALLGSLFGGGEELSWLEFDAGRYAVPQSGAAKLDSLAKALNDRPALKLEITGRFDPATDLDGLRRAGMERKVRALKLKQLVGKGESVDLDTLTIRPDEYPALLAKVYKNEDFPKPRNVIGLQKDLPVEEMEKLMMANARISDDDLVALGNRRAQAAKDWLVKNGAVPAERIFIVAAKGNDGGDSKAKPTRADFSLR